MLNCYRYNFYAIDDRYSDTPISLKYPSIDLQVFPYFDKKYPSPDPQPLEQPDHPKDHFMAIACLALQRSKDPSRKVY